MEDQDARGQPVEKGSGQGGERARMLEQVLAQETGWPGSEDGEWSHWALIDPERVSREALHAALLPATEEMHLKWMPGTGWWMLKAREPGPALTGALWAAGVTLGRNNKLRALGPAPALLQVPGQEE